MPRPTPTFDIGGFDTAHKLTLLTSLAFGTRVALDQVHVEGIETISEADIAAADDLGYRIKLLGVALMTESGIEQRVHPAMVPKHSAIAEVSGVTNCVAIDGDYCGNLLLAGAGAGGKATASAVASDILDIARGDSPPPFGVPAAKLKPTSAPSWVSIRAPITCASRSTTGPAPWRALPAGWASARCRWRASCSGGHPARRSALPRGPSPARRPP
jgi:hypothetical protein